MILKSTKFLSLLRRSKEEKLIINGVEGFKSNQSLTMATIPTHEMQKTTTDRRQYRKGYTPPSSSATEDEICAHIKDALGEELNTPDTNFMYRVLPDGQWIHVHGPLILPGCEWINEDELAAARAVRETHEGYEGRW